MKNIIAYILSFILTISIVLSILVGVLSNTILSKSYFLGKLDEISFYNRISEEIEDTFQNYILQSGMDETVLENIYTKEKLQQDIQNVVAALYENQALSIETESIKEKLLQNIEDFLAEKQLEIDNYEEVNIFIHTIADTYKDGIVYSGKIMKQLAPLTSKAITQVRNIQPIVYATTAIIAFLVIAISWKEKSNIAKYLGISMLAAGGTVMIVKAMLDTQLHIEGIMLLNNVITSLIQNIYTQMVEYIFYMGAITAILGGVLLIIKVMRLKEN